MRLVAWFLVLTLPVLAQAAEIEGGAERRGFTPGDVVVFATHLTECPVGEPAPDLALARGGYECARFKDRIWLRPLNSGTVVYAVFPKPVDGDFSLEFPVWLAEDGCAYVEFRLHHAQQMARFDDDSLAYADGAFIGGHLACSREKSGFGSRNSPGRVRFDIAARLQKDRIHRVAVQVRRGQVRFYLDGQRVGMRPYRPSEPIAGISFYFAKAYGTATPYADAPALVGDIRLATYSQAEAAPEAERDLIRDLGAEETPEGLKVTLSESILFDFGKWDFKPGARASLEKLARLARLRKGTVRVEGHTDDIGSERFNLVLSELRAHVVALALARLGVDPKRLRPKGYGETRPVAPNDSDANRARNRRVEVILSKE